MLELIFHSRISSDYPCLTHDPNIANAVYIPYYAALDAHHYLYGPDTNRSAEHGLDLFHFRRRDFPSLWDPRSCHDHFLIMARPAWDFSQSLTNQPRTWGTSFPELPQFYNVTAMVVESRAWAWAWQAQASPNPTSFHPPSVSAFESWVRRVRRWARTTLMVLVGVAGIGSGLNIPRSTRLECDNNTSTITKSGDGVSKVCEFVNYSEGVCEHDPIRFMKPMLEARLSCAAGRRADEAVDVQCNCCRVIPLFLEEASAKLQSRWHLGQEEYDEFSVVTSKGIRIVDVLGATPEERVRRMRKKVIELMPRVVYRKPGAYFKWDGMKDAFDIAVEGALKRGPIRSCFKKPELDDHPAT